MSSQVADHQYQQALATVEAEDVSLEDKVQMLMEIAMGLQQKPKGPQQLLDAVKLYERAIELCPANETLVAARLQARKATALQMIPSHEADYLLEAQICLETAVVTLEQQGSPEEAAEAQMNYGLVLQSLAGMHRAPITDAINAYQRSLRTFTREAFPAEYTILHNNLASAYLSIPMTDERSKMREALAVQSFEAALEVVTLVDNPSEYAMLQNNLGNALQYASSSHGVENNLRALDAYDEALKVRTETDTPQEYANTISNKANCLRNLPDDPEQPEKGNRQRLGEARNLYQRAQALFRSYGETPKVEMLDEVLAEIAAEMGNGQEPDNAAQSTKDSDFGEARFS